MTTDELNQIGKLLDTKLEAEREHTRKLIEASEKRLKQAILDSQEDTTKVVGDLIHEGYTMHEERLERLEEHTGLTPHKN